MDHPSRSMEDSAKGNMDYAGSSQKVSKETILLIFWQRMWLIFAIVLKNFPESKLNSFGLMTFAEKIQDSLLLVVSHGY